MVATDELIYNEKVKQLYALLPIGIIGSVVNSCILTAAHIQIVPNPILITWLSFQISYAIIRLGILITYNFKNKKLTNFHSWGVLFKILATLSGFLWGIAAFFSFFHMSTVHTLFVAYVIGGMIAGNSGAFAAFRYNYFGFAIPASIFQITIFIISNNPVFHLMAGMFAFFVILLSFTSKSTWQLIDKSIRLSFEKTDLIDSLSKEKAATETSNQQLKKEVERRLLTEKELITARENLESKVLERTEELRSANINLQKSEELYRIIVETSQEGICILDSNKIVQFANSRLAKILDYDISQIIGANIGLFVNQPQYDLQTQIREADLIRKDSTTVKVLESISSLPIPVGNNGQILIMITDISGLKKREEEVRTYARSLEEKNRELDSFTHSVSHDLRSPLMSIEGLTQILKDDYSEKFNEDAKNILKLIIDNTKKMSAIIDDLLKLSRISRQELKKQKVCISDIVHSIIDDLKHADPSRKVVFELESNIYGIVDSGLITIALKNLLHNAWKYTCKTDHAIIKFGQFIKDNKIIFYVQDNGIGFDMVNAPKLFKPFTRLHSQKEFAGTGIGLVIVNRIIQKHGGTIWVESRPNFGTTFFFTLE